MLIVSDKSGNGKGAGFSRRAEVIGELEEVAISDAVYVFGEFNASLSGTFVATMQLVRSLDNGASFQPLTALGNSFTFTGPCEEVFNEPQPGVLYAWECTSYTSGTVEYRIGQ
jgi:hypothetical protein